ncbi:MAG: hypothetical protein R3C99_07250 [Pirellulaceae bacterium]
MFGWLSRASARASRENRSANEGSRAVDGKILEPPRADPGELSSLCRTAPVRRANQVQNLKLREVRLQVVRFRRYETRAGVVERASVVQRIGSGIGVGSHRQLHHVSRATCGDVGWQGGRRGAGFG